jgi:peptide/nickel transport system substrate-binding protein
VSGWHARRGTPGVALAVLLGLFVAGCGGTNDGGGGGGAAAGVSNLVWAKSFDVESLDPGHAHEITGSIVQSATYDRLVQFEGSDPELKPMAAESWEASDDQRRFTFTLRDDVTFADGSRLTANDVVFSFERLRNLKGAPAYRLDGVDKIEAPDDRTVVLTTTEPMPGLPAALASTSFSILNSKLVEQNGGTAAANAARKDGAQAWLDEHSAGSGPYMLERYERRARIVLKANPEYWGGKAGFESIILKNVPTENQLLEVQRGSSQLAVDLSPNQVGGARTDELEVQPTPAATTFFLVANTDPKVAPNAANPDFQEAIRYGIDYEDLVQLVGEGAKQLPGVIPSMVPGKLEDAEGPARDVERAKAALARSGVENPTVELEYANDFTLAGLDFGVVAQRIQSQLKEVGIQVTLTPGPLATTLENWRGGKEELGLWTTTPDRPAADDYLDFCPGELQALRVNWQAEDDPDLLEVCETARTMPPEDPDYESTFQELQRQLNERGPYFPLFQPAQVLVADGSVSNLEYSPMFLVDLQRLGGD